MAPPSNNSLSPASKDEINQILKQLFTQGFLVSEQENNVNSIFSTILGNQLDGLNLTPESLKPVLFFSDNEVSVEAFRLLANKMSLPIEIMSEIDFQRIESADILSRIDSIHVEQQIQDIGKIFSDFSCVVGNFGQLNITFLRNLNRILVRLEKGLILSYLDGPFMGVTSLFPPETGCFECLENRILARLEDTIAYHNFLKKPVGKNSQNFYEINSPWIHLMTSLTASESLLASATGLTKFRGRLLNIYLPVFEIQVQDVLRVPYCPACGHLSKARVNELYTSSKGLIDNMIQSIGASV